MANPAGASTPHLDVDHMWPNLFDYTDTPGHAAQEGDGRHMLLAFADTFHRGDAAASTSTPAAPLTWPATAFAPSAFQHPAPHRAAAGPPAWPSDASAAPHCGLGLSIPPTHPTSRLPSFSEAQHGSAGGHQAQSSSHGSGDSRDSGADAGPSGVNDNAQSGLYSARPAARHPRRSGRPKTLPADPDGQMKRTRGEREKIQLSALQQVVDGKALELLQLSFENTSLLDQQQLLADLVQFRGHQVEFLRRSQLPQAALPMTSPDAEQPPWLMSAYPWLRGNQTNAPTSVLIREPTFQLFPGPGGLPSEMFKTCGVTDILHQYKLAAIHVGDLLLEIDAPPDAAEAELGMRKLSDFMQLFSFGMATITMCNPAGFKVRSMCCDPNRPMPPAHSYWLLVLDALKLTFVQRRRLADAYALIRARLSELEVERADIGVQLQQLIGLADWQFSQENVLKQDMLASILYDNVMKEKSVNVLIGGFLRTNIFTIIQDARCIVTSYPYIPDHLALAAIVYEEFQTAKR